ncbi:DSBA oxidoreductase [Caballeronia hypogeia]|uniref:DSBA oxidoreductase n=1 Tax=Caballeronia hypogeia TaxID=1777140 RepID=A0A158AHQ3_9BURK|nr:DsbA family oxidoreductase [Caballeronia hypogeia]SAK56607.1 DSBA oxidoreductase [Caballeronia hypogeia]
MDSSELRYVEATGREIGERRTMTIEVFFDFICPWCLIGKRNLEAAITRFASLRPDVRLKVLWRSHQLLPYTPLEGMPYQAFYLDRLGSHEAVAARREQVRRAGIDAGIVFAFERIEVMPNTAAAHDLVAYAARRGDEARRDRLIERMFDAYFMEGLNIGDRKVLERLGLECGLEHEGLVNHLAESKRMSDPAGRAAPYIEEGVSGVPHFVFDTRYTLSGAHSPGAIFEAMMLTARH